MKNLVPVLLAGGIGSRLWPLSREHYPKQLLSLLGDDSLLQATLRRILCAEDIHKFIVICNEEHRFEVLTQINEVKPDCEFTIILEPMGRNTAPAAALAALYLQDNENLLFMPADHVLKSEDVFLAQVNRANDLASQGHLLTFGIQPTYPEAGYGYIEVGAQIQKDVFRIEKFVEKPDKKTADRFLKAGNYYWNSGIFLFSKDTLLTELKTYAADIYSSVKAAADSFETDGPFMRVEPDLFRDVPDLSIDYAIMEHTKNALMLPLTIPWSDIGSWQSLYSYEDKDDNATVAIGDVINIDNKGCYLRSETHMMAAVGLHNIVAVQTADCVLIADINQSQKVKDVVKTLKIQDRHEALMHLTQYHPWGVSSIINHEQDFIIKRVDIEPKQGLSLHSHEHSSETWLILSGEAEVFVNDDISNYRAGESFYIAVQERHKIMNRGNNMLSMLEVMRDGKLLDKDIIRYDG